MHRYAETADRFLAEPFPAQESETAEELNAIKTALYARALTVFDTARLLLQADRQLDGRIHSRAAIEAAMYLLALDRDPSFVEKMKADDHKSRHERASLYLKADRPRPTRRCSNCWRISSTRATRAPRWFPWVTC